MPTLKVHRCHAVQTIASATLRERNITKTDKAGKLQVQVRGPWSAEHAQARATGVLQLVDACGHVRCTGTTTAAMKKSGRDPWGEYWGVLVSAPRLHTYPSRWAAGMPACGPPPPCADFKAVLDKQD